MAGDQYVKFTFWPIFRANFLDMTHINPAHRCFSKVFDD